LITVNYKPYCVAPTIQYKKGDPNNDGTKQGQVENIDGIDLLCQVDAKPKAGNFRYFEMHFTCWDSPRFLLGQRTSRAYAYACLNRSQATLK